MEITFNRTKIIHQHKVVIVGIDYEHTLSKFIIAYLIDTFKLTDLPRVRPSLPLVLNSLLVMIL